MTGCLIFGRGGYLAQACRAAWPSSVISGADVTSPVDVRRALDVHDPLVVVNAAGKTHGRRFSNIDGCEEDAEARALTRAVNVFGAEVVRDACARFDLPLVHLGSGCVYDGQGLTPITEDTTPNPQSWYAETKVLGDAALLAYPRALVLRLRMPFAAVPHPRNLLTKLAGYDAVVDAPNSITDVATLIGAIETLVSVGATGLYHVVQPDPVSPYAIARLLGRTPTRLTPDDLNAQTRARRSNCVLSVAKAQATGVTLPLAADLLRQYVGQVAA